MTVLTMTVLTMTVLVTRVVLTELVTGLLSVFGALVILTSAIAMRRARDAYLRISALSPATGLGLPLIVVAAWVHELGTDGFRVTGLIYLVCTIVSLLIVSSVGSNLLCRAAFLSGADVCPETEPNDLAEPSSEPATPDV